MRERNGDWRMEELRLDKRKIRRLRMTEKCRLAEKEERENRKKNEKKKLMRIN